MINEETIYCLGLNQIEELGPVLIKRLFLRFGSAKDIFNATIDELESVEGIGKERAKRIKNFDRWSSVEQLIKLCMSRDIAIYSFSEDKYPKLLKEINDPPVVIFCKGELLPQDNVALSIVGSRKLSEYGRIVTEKLAYELASLGITIVSGLARGIDSIAHKSALSAEGRTIAVVGSGVSVIYPPENKMLAEKIIKRGAIISEFYPDERPKRENFPRRNRIISGLSFGTLVTEATKDSGALITTSFAIEQGREVFAVPGNINSKNSEGTNFLIQKGAKLVTKVEDILEEIQQFIPLLKKINRDLSVETKKVKSFNSEEKTIFDILNEPLYLDEIILKTGIDTSKVIEILLNFEIEGLINKVEGKYVRRI